MNGKCNSGCCTSTMNKSWNIGDLNRGKGLSGSTKQKISLKLQEGYKKGRRPWNRGISLPERVKQKISESKKGTVPWNLGASLSEETKRKISASRKGKSAWNKGRIISPAHKKAISEGMIKRWKRQEVKNN